MSGQSGNQFWFALRTKPRHEKSTALALRGRGLEEFLPLAQKRRRWSDRTVDLELPLFPGYVFCRFDPWDRLPIVTTPGVRSVVGFGRTLIAVEDGEIASLQVLARSGLEAQPWPFLEVGQVVWIESGPLTGCEGIVLDFKGTRRLVLSVMLLQRAVAVEVDRPCVRPCHRRPVAPLNSFAQRLAA